MVCANDIGKLYIAPIRRWRRTEKKKTTTMTKYRKKGMVLLVRNRTEQQERYPKRE
jgi:hypothetical protein